MHHHVKDVLRAPSARLPFALSVIACLGMVTYVAAFGIVHHDDEGTPARLFQTLLLIEALAIVYFAIRWLPREPRTVTAVLALQIVVAVIPIVAIIVLESRATG